MMILIFKWSEIGKKKKSVFRIKSMQKKTKGRKNYVLEAKEVAKLAGSSVSTVKQVRVSANLGEVQKGKKAIRIVTIDALAEQSKSILIQEVKRIVNL